MKEDGKEENNDRKKRRSERRVETNGWRREGGHKRMEERGG